MQVDMNALPDDDGFSAIPEGDYPFTISKITQKNWDDGSPKGVSVEHTVTGDKYNNRKLFEFFTLFPHGSDQEKVNNIKRINGARLKQLAKACGFTEQQPMTDTSQLMGRSGIASVGFQKKKDSNGNLQNQIKSWKPSSNAPQPGGFPGQPAQPQQPVNANPFAQQS